MQKLSESELSGEDRTLILQMADMWGGFIGDPWDKQSLRYFWLEECLDGGESYFWAAHSTFRLATRQATFFSRNAGM